MISSLYPSDRSNMSYKIFLNRLKSKESFTILQKVRGQLVTVYFQSCPHVDETVPL